MSTERTFITKKGLYCFSDKQDLLINENFALTWNQISEQLLNLVVANLEKNISPMVKVSQFASFGGEQS